MCSLFFTENSLNPFLSGSRKLTLEHPKLGAVLGDCKGMPSNVATCFGSAPYSNIEGELMRLLAKATAAAALACAALTLLPGCAAAPQPTPPQPAPSPEPTAEPTPGPTPVAVDSWSSAAKGEPRLTLYDDGTLGGFDGCNAFGGTYVRTDDLLELHLGYGTLMACIGVDLWLRDASSAHIDGDSLLVYDATGNRIGTLSED